MKTALMAEGLYDEVYFPTNRPRSIPLSLAISQSGGTYYRWNDGLIYWSLGAVLSVAGILLPFVEPRKPPAS